MEKQPLGDNGPNAKTALNRPKIAKSVSAGNAVLVGYRRMPTWPSIQATSKARSRRASYRPLAPP